jgi:hypothetical protein
MMRRLEAAATPGPAHRALDTRVGTWSAVVEIFTPFSPDPVTTTSTSEVEWILDGRFQQEHVSGDFQGTTFHGIGFRGYDNLKRKYVAFWVDDHGTGVAWSEGDYDARTRTFHWTGRMPDAISGGYVATRSVEKVVDDDHWSYESWNVMPGGREVKSMALRATRVR